MKKIDLKIVHQAAVVLKVIGHPQRLRIVEALENKSKTVTELMAELRLSQVSVSKHLAILKKSGIVASKVQSHFRYYSIIYPKVLNILNCLRIHGGKGR